VKRPELKVSLIAPAQEWRMGQDVDSQLALFRPAFRLTLDLFNNTLITGTSRTKRTEP